MNTSMKNGPKLLILEICFFLLVSAYIPFGIFGDAYVQSRTLNRPCGLGFKIPCVYTPLADWFDYVLHRRDHSAILHAFDIDGGEARFVASEIAGNGAAGATLGELFIIAFWMAVLNLAYFGGRSVIRTARSHVSNKPMPPQK